MRTGNIIFNAVGLTFGLLFTLAGCGQLAGHDKEWVVPWTMLVTLLIGGGSLVNLCERRLVAWSTIAIIAGYFFTLFLFPFGIWGIVALVQSQRRRGRR